MQMTPAQSPGPPQPMSPMNNNSGGTTAICSLGSNMNNNNSSLMMNEQRVSCMCDPHQLTNHVKLLRSEVMKLRNRLQIAEKEHNEKMALFEKEEREQREQNVRLQRKLQMEIERRERLCRHLRLF